MTLNNGLKVVGLSTFSNAVDVNATAAFGDNVTFETNNGNNVQFNKGSNFFKLGDNVELKLGNASDLEIKHSSSSNNSHIKNNTGDLKIRGDVIKLNRADDTEKYLHATANSDVKIYFNDNERFATSSTGAVSYTHLTLPTILLV